MNLLAHAVLSFQQPGVLVGNLVADHLKGTDWAHYPPEWQLGIRLHRSIDAFTDAHEATKAISRLLKPSAGRYGAAFADLVYDYFLANDERIFATEAYLDAFARSVYARLEAVKTQLPASFLPLLAGMHKHHFLYRYRQLEGMEKAFAGLSARARYLQENPFHLFVHHLPLLQKEYERFWPGVAGFASQWLGQQTGTIPAIFTRHL